VQAGLFAHRWAQRRWVVKPAIAARQRPFLVNADADAKLNHYKNAGCTITEAHAASGMQPLLLRYFSATSVLEQLMQAGSGGGEEQVAGVEG